MKMMVEFDCDADIIDVPQYVIDNREIMRKRFLKWIYNRSIKHKYWVVCYNGKHKYCALRYRGDAFVEWLNKKVIQEDDSKAILLEQHVPIDEYAKKYPSVQF